jgi:hypothetical protein
MNKGRLSLQQWPDWISTYVREHAVEHCDGQSPTRKLSAVFIVRDRPATDADITALFIGRLPLVFITHLVVYIGTG